MSKLIRDNVECLQKLVTEYQKRILNWQSHCKHEIVKGEYKANTGNYCPDDDSYWISAKCLDCGKHIHAKSGTEEYRQLSMSGMISSEYDSRDKIIKQEEIRRNIEEARK